MIRSMNSPDIERERKWEFIKKAISEYNLNLGGLTILTEAASGNYLYTPIIAALAGAVHVYAVTTDSKYGKKEEVSEKTLREAESLGVADAITVVFKKQQDFLAASDIITNSGFVRPITKEIVSYLKPTAVIPLMWETWEFRPDDLDLAACRERSILVLGTNEHHPSLNLLNSVGFLICKLLFDKGFDVYKDNLLLIASGHIGDNAADFFISNNISFNRVAFDSSIPEHQKPFIRSREEVINSLDKYDAIIIAELQHNIDILSCDGFISTELLRQKNRLVQIVHICGTVNKNDIIKEGLALYPEDVRPFGYMTVNSDYLSAKITLQLTTAGLKVGEIMARSRLKYDFEKAYEESIKNPLVNDFEGGYLNLQIDNLGGGEFSSSFKKNNRSSRPGRSTVR